MNGPNMDLPLFIPNIQTGQDNVNLTTYAVSLSFQQTFRVNELGFYTCNIAPLPTIIIFEPECLNPILAPSPRSPSVEQDISTRYYWITTYQHWINLVNKALAKAHRSVYDNFVLWWNDIALLPIGYETYDNFTSTIQIPQIIYNEATTTFTILADSDAFGKRLNTFVPNYDGGAWTPPQMRMFFGTNLYGLFSNFPTLFWNSIVIPATTYDGVVYPAFPNGAPAVWSPNTFPIGYVPEGYVNEIMFPNKFYQNVADYRIPPYSGVPPLGYVPISAQKAYWRNEQDFPSTDSLWSPISSIVFTTTLLPLKTENASQPNVLGTGNLGDSRPTSKSAFEPIITDIALDTAQRGACDYRKFIYYSPVAEYRMSSFTASPQEIRNINIAVFWKNRLDSKLYPINMYNLSTVSLKMLFRKRGVKGDK